MSSPGRPRNSSPIGKGCRIVQSTASNCWKIVSRCSAARLDRSCFNCRRISKPIPTGLLRSSSCCRRSDVTVSNSDTRAGIRIAFLDYCPSETSRFASPTTMTRHRHGSALPTSSIYVDTGRRGATRGIIVPMYWRIGYDVSSRGNGRDATCSSISTMTRRVRHLPTRSDYAGCWNDGRASRLFISLFLFRRLRSRRSQPFIDASRRFRLPCPFNQRFALQALRQFSCGCAGFFGSFLQSLIEWNGVFLPISLRHWRLPR